MSSKAKRPNAMDKLVVKRELLQVVAAFRKVTRLLEERIEALERPGAPCIGAPEWSETEQRWVCKAS